MTSLRLRGPSALLLAAALAAGCGSSSGSPGGDGGAGQSGGPHGCTSIQGSCSSNDGMTCEEWAGYDAATVARFKSGCNHPNQVWSDGPCNRAGSVGGCEVAVNGVCDVIWSFPPITASDLQMSCMGQYQMFVTP